MINSDLTKRYKTERNNCSKDTKQKNSSEILEELFLLDLETEMVLKIVQKEIKCEVNKEIERDDNNHRYPALKMIGGSK